MTRLTLLLAVLLATTGLMACKKAPTDAAQPAAEAEVHAVEAAPAEPAPAPVE